MNDNQNYRELIHVSWETTFRRISKLDLLLLDNKLRYLAEFYFQSI